MLTYAKKLARLLPMQHENSIKQERRTVGVPLPLEIIAQIDEVARREGITRAAVVRRIVYRSLDSNPPARA
jgi:metal-responsive CopG/Arc/MetJ family transcriptional regulator